MMKKKKKKRKRGILVQHEEETRAAPAYQAAAPAENSTSTTAGGDSGTDRSSAAAPSVSTPAPPATASADELELAAKKLFPDHNKISCPENLAVMYPQAQQILEAADNESRCPGVNCCAVCAAPTEGPDAAVGSTECKRCGRVVYCSPNCAAVDLRVHARACRLLRLSELDQSFQETCHLPEPSPIDMAAVKVPPPPWADGWDGLLGTQLPLLRRWAVSARLSHTFTLINAVWHLSSLGTYKRAIAGVAPSL
jgi:hypothetical protein